MRATFVTVYLEVRYTVVRLLLVLAARQESFYFL